MVLKNFNNDHIMASWLNPVETTPVYSNIEYVCVKIIAVKLRLNVSVTYRTPGQTHEKDAEMYLILRQTLNSETEILGAFNVSQIDWQNCFGVESESQRMIHFIEDNFLH